MKFKYGQFVPMAIIAAATLGACGNKADVDVNTDSTGMHVDTMATAPADTMMPAPADTVNTMDTVGAGTGMKDESIEKVVEAKLVVKPGFSGVTVASSGNGVIVLNGTVASQAEKDQAEQVAKGTDGVKQVQNNLTIAGK